MLTETQKFTFSTTNRMNNNIAKLLDVVLDSSLTSEFHTISTFKFLLCKMKSFSNKKYSHKYFSWYNSVTHKPGKFNSFKKIFILQKKGDENNYKPENL